MREYLSNHYAGRRPDFLSDFERENLAGRIAFARSEGRFREPRLRPLAIFQLHHCDACAPRFPKAAVPAAHFALELAEKTRDSDLISWAESGIGNLSRILSDFDAGNRRMLKARRIAVNPLQKGDSTRRYALLLLTFAGEDPKEIKRALKFFTKALQFLSLAPERIYSDRSYSGILHDEAISHLTLGHLGRPSHIEVGKAHLLEVLNAASPHARLSQDSAVFNLTRLHLKLDERPPQELLEKLEAQPTTKSSLRGALTQWLLVFEEIRAHGYKRKYRKRLLSVRGHLKGHGAWEYASTLTLAIAALDASQEKPGALPFLQQDESEEILLKGEPTLAKPIMEAHYMAPGAIVSLAEAAGAGNVYSMIASSTFDVEHPS